MLIALDVATRVGFAAGPAGIAVPEFGVKDFGKLTTTDDPRRNGAIVSAFRAWLNELCFQHKPTMVAFESPYVPVAKLPKIQRGGIGAKPAFVPGPPPMDPAVLRRLLGMTGTVEAVCWELGIDCREARTVEFTKFFTGRGSWPGMRQEKKQQTIRACLDHGWDVQGSDDAADACALWAYAEDMIAPDIASRRRILRANRLRQVDGGGPLFSRNAEAPGAGTPGADGNPQSDEERSSNAQQQYTQFATGGQPMRDIIGRKAG